MSAEKIFRSEARLFCLCSGDCLVSDAVLGSVFAVSGCASMLVSVTFYVGMRDAWTLRADAIQKGDFGEVLCFALV